MSPILAGLLVVLGIGTALVVAVAAPVLVAVIVREILVTEESPSAEAGAPSADSIAMKRGGARAFVLGGGVFWSLASFAGLYSYQQTGAGSALTAALYPLAACIVTLAVGWYFERAVAVMLVIAAQAVVVWGVVYQFEMGVWVLMTLALIGPMLTAAVLFWLARGDQEAFELKFSTQPELHLLFSARSELATVRAAA